MLVAVVSTGFGRAGRARLSGSRVEWRLACSTTSKRNANGTNWLLLTGTPQLQVVPPVPMATTGGRVGYRAVEIDQSLASAGAEAFS